MSSNSSAHAPSNPYTFYEIPQGSVRASTSQAEQSTTEATYLSPRGLYQPAQDLEEVDSNQVHSGINIARNN